MDNKEDAFDSQDDDDEMEQGVLFFSCAWCGEQLGSSGRKAREHERSHHGPLASPFLLALPFSCGIQALPAEADDDDSPSHAATHQCCSFCLKEHDDVAGAQACERTHTATSIMGREEELWSRQG